MQYVDQFAKIIDNIIILLQFFDSMGLVFR